MTKKLEDILNLPNVKEAFKEVDKKEQLWEISKDETSLGIFSDGEEEVRLLIENQVARCQEKLSREVGNVISYLEHGELTGDHLQKVCLNLQQ